MAAEDRTPSSRDLAKIVRAYLESLTVKGVKLSREDIDKRIIDVESQIGDEDDVLVKLSLRQERLNLMQMLVDLTAQDQRPELERAFVRWGGMYARHHKISRAAWRESGVPAAVLDEAGIT